MCRILIRSAASLQVHGAVKDAMRHVTEVLHIEINSVTDNPTVFPDDDLVVSGGNFHGEPIALVFDYMGVALSELGNISERRVAQLSTACAVFPSSSWPNLGSTRAS